MSLTKTGGSIMRAAIAALALMAPGAIVESYGAEQDVALLKSYIGSWRGRGDIHWGGSGDVETILCRMSVQDSTPTKVGVDSRCSLAGATLSMLGTLAYVDANSRYEAIVSSSTQFSGIAIGHRAGEDLSFDLRDYKGDDNQLYDISAEINLLGENIEMALRIVNKETGDITTAEIPFDRK